LMVARTAQGTNLGATSGPSGAMGADTSYETLTALNPAHLKALLGQEVVVTLGDASTRTGIVYNVDPVNFSVALLKPRRPLIKGTQGENRVPARAPPPRRPATPQIRDVHPRGFPTILDFYLTDRRPPPDVSSQLHRRDTTARITCASSPATRSRAWRWWADNARRWSASRPEPPSGGTLDRRRRRRLRL